MSDAYSPYKALRHLDVIQGVREGRPVRPVHVQIILSDLCQQACGFCAFRDPSYTSSQMFYEIKPSGSGLRRDKENPERNYNPGRMIPWDKVVEILDDCKAMGVSGIQLTGGGEPTLHPQWSAAVDYAVASGMRASMVTNGVVIGKRGGPAFDVASQLDWMRISIDAARPETYCGIRNVPEWHYESAWSAVRGMAGRTVLGVGFVVTEQNWREIYDFAKMAKEAGASNVRLGAQFSTEEERRFAGFYDEASALAKKAEELTGDGFEVVNRFGEKILDLKQRRPEYGLCGYQHETVFIGGDQNVYRCCVTAYNKQGLVGSIKDRSFRDLWMSQERADEMRLFDARSCERCQFNAQNRLLAYAMAEDEPLHSAFV